MVSLVRLLCKHGDPSLTLKNLHNNTGHSGAWCMLVVPAQERWRWTGDQWLESPDNEFRPSESLVPNDNKIRGHD